MTDFKHALESAALHFVSIQSTVNNDIGNRARHTQCTSDLSCQVKELMYFVELFSFFLSVLVKSKVYLPIKRERIIIVLKFESNRGNGYLFDTNAHP